MHDNNPRLDLFGSSKCKYYTFICSVIDIAHINASLAYSLLHYPNLLLPIFNDALLTSQESLFKTLVEATNFSVKRFYFIRISNLPPIYEYSRTSIGQIRSFNDSHALLQVCGTVVRTSSVRLLEKSKVYQCMNPKCLHKFKISADPELGNTLSMPKSCPKIMNSPSDISSNISNQKKNQCSSTSFRELENERECLVIKKI